MKKLLFIVCALVSLQAAAQVRLNGYANYTFDDKVDNYYEGGAYWEGKLKGGFQWGTGIEYMAHPNYGIELSYYRQDLGADITYRPNGLTGIRTDKFDVGLNWIFLSGNRYIRKPGSKFEGFGGLGLGMCIIGTENTRTGAEGDATKFAWQLRGGGILWASEKVGIKLNAQLQSAVQSLGGGFSIGTGGAGVGVSSYSSLLQFSLGGGIVFKLDGTAKAK